MQEPNDVGMIGASLPRKGSDSMKKTSKGLLSQVRRQRQQQKQRKMAAVQAELDKKRQQEEGNDRRRPA